MKINDFLYEDQAFSQLDKTSKLILAHWRNDETVPSSLHKKFAKSSDREILKYLTDLITRYVHANIKNLKQDVVIGWFLKSYSNGTPFEDLLRRGGEAMEQYASLLHSKVFQGNHSDLNTYRTVEELEHYIDVLYRGQYREKESDFANAKAVKIWEDGNLLIVVPLNKEAAGKYGAGTRWCTTDQDCDDYDDDEEDYDDLYDRNGRERARPEFDPDSLIKADTAPSSEFVRDGSTFADYFKNGPLVIFIDKHDPESKYQFHAPSNQPMDAGDNVVPPALFRRDYPDAIMHAVAGLKKHASEFNGYIKNVNKKADEFLKRFKAYAS